MPTIDACEWIERDETMLKEGLAAYQLVGGVTDPQGKDG